MSVNSPELVRASQQGDLPTVRKLVESGADVNSVGDHGMGPLLLLDAGADKTLRDANGDSPQTWASWHWRPKGLIDLLDPQDVT
jgi:hypothetical protein